MKKIKPLVFICVGLMTIATLYGAIDLAKSNSSDELKDLYVEKTEEERPAETAEKKIEKVAVAAVEEKGIVKMKEKIIKKKEAKKLQKEINKSKEKEAYNKPVEEVIEAKKKKELEWESFSRKAVDRKFKKAKALTDSVQQVRKL